MLPRALPLIGMLLLVAIALVWRPWLQYRRHGMFGVVVFQSTSRRQNLRDAVAIVAFGALIWQAAEAATRPLDAHFVVAAGALAVPGALLLIGGLALLVAGQLGLGASWRIGIEEGARPGLVTHGLYAISRNPIFAGLLAMLAGYALLLPTWLSIVVFLGAMVGVRQQVLAEERYLVATYGDAFRAYARRVGRFVPGMGLLP